MQYHAIAPSAGDLLLDDRLLKWCKANAIPLVVSTRSTDPQIAECSTPLAQVSVGDRTVAVMNLVTEGGVDLRALTDMATKARGRGDHVILVSHLTRPQTETILSNPQLRECLAVVLIAPFDEATTNGEVSSLAGIPAAPLPPAAHAIAQLSLGGPNGVGIQNHRVTEDADPDPDVAKLVASYLRQLGETAGQSVPGVPWTMKSVEYQFAPAQACGECHPAQYDAWRRGPHAGSVAALKLENRAMTDCMVCHSEYLRRTRWLPAASEDGGGVECSACHGDGVVHALTRDPARIDRTPLDALCQVCHTPDHSPHFEPVAGREAIRH